MIKYDVTYDPGHQHSYPSINVSIMVDGKWKIVTPNMAEELQRILDTHSNLTRE